MSGEFAGRGEEERSVVECRFVADRNVLLVSADFGPVFVDCYLHLARVGLVLRDGADEILKKSLAAIALYGATRPCNETLAWTLHFDDESLNVFVAADLVSGRLTGRVFSGNVRDVGKNVLHAEVAGPRGSRRRSSVDFSGNDVLRAAERFYEQSEQRPGKFFHFGGDAFGAIAAQPDCDIAWFDGVSSADVAALVADDRSRPMESRCYVFDCGCTPERIAAAIGGALSGKLDEIYGPDSHINVDCPRCGLRHELPRELFA